MHQHFAHPAAELSERLGEVQHVNDKILEKSNRDVNNLRNMSSKGGGGAENKKQHDFKSAE
eukprot:3665342-Pleurochrysis_carterae.AAC.1